MSVGEREREGGKGRETGGGCPRRAAPRVHLRRAVPSASASHRSVIKNDEGKYIMGAPYRYDAVRRGAVRCSVAHFSRASRPSRVQITGALHGVGWKLVLGIEGGAQGNCYTANGFTSACLPTYRARPYLTLPLPLPLLLLLPYLTLTAAPPSLVFSLLSSFPYSIYNPLSPLFLIPSFLPRFYSVYTLYLPLPSSTPRQPVSTRL